MKIISLVVAACALVGCTALAEHPKSIRPMTISPSEYASYSCDALRASQLAAWRRQEDVRIPLKSAAEDFGLPALTHEYAELKHEYSELLGSLQTIPIVAFQRGCEIDTTDDLKRAYGLDGIERPHWPSQNPKQLNLSVHR